METQQAVTTANQNLQENAQRKSILNAMLGTRVFRGSALSRALRGNAPGNAGEEAMAAPSASQQNSSSTPVTPFTQSLLDTRQSEASGATPAGGTGASANAAAISAARGSYGGGGSSARGPIA